MKAYVRLNLRLLPLNLGMTTAAFLYYAMQHGWIR